MLDLGGVVNGHGEKAVGRLLFINFHFQYFHNWSVCAKFVTMTFACLTQQVASPVT